MPSYTNPRLKTEYLKLFNAKVNVRIRSGRDNELEVIIDGPSDTPYRDGKFRVIIKLSDNYPYKSPSVGFGTRVYHPNIDEKSGSVCLDVLNQYWSPMYDCTNIVQHFLPLLLSYPNALDPLNPDAAAEFIKNKESFDKTVQNHCKIYSHVEKTKENDDSDSHDSDSCSSLEI